MIQSLLIQSENYLKFKFRSSGQNFQPQRLEFSIGTILLKQREKYYKILIF